MSVRVGSLIRHTSDNDIGVVMSIESTRPHSEVGGFAFSGDIYFMNEKRVFENSVYFMLSQRLYVEYRSWSVPPDITDDVDAVVLRY